MSSDQSEHTLALLKVSLRLYAIDSKPRITDMFADATLRSISDRDDETSPPLDHILYHDALRPNPWGLYDFASKLIEPLRDESIRGRERQR